MYDTIVLKSPEIDLDTKNAIMSFCNRYEGFDFATGEIIYSFTRAELDGSYDYRIRLAVDNTEYIKVGSQTPQKVLSYWHLKVECSLHKLLLNHNVFGGPTDIQKSVAYLIKVLSELMYVDLPNYRNWEVQQIDVAKIFYFNDSNICRRIMSNLKNAYYSRRKPIIYDTSIMFSGSTTTNKFYYKGPEYKKHDYKRINKYIQREFDLSYSLKNDGDRIRSELLILKIKFDKLLDKANRIIRYECAIKLRKLKDLFGHDDKVLVYMLNDNILHVYMESELKKLIKEDDELDIIRRSDLVLERLIKLHGTVLGNSLYATWVKIVQFGEAGAKDTISKRTFYRHKKILIENGVSWQCTVINLKPFSIVPADFSFTNNNYVLDIVDDEVIKLLSKIA